MERPDEGMQQSTSVDTEKDLHPLVGGESLEVLMNPETVAADAKVLQKAFLWPTIEQPSAAQK